MKDTKPEVICLRVNPDGSEELLASVPKKRCGLIDHFILNQLQSWVGGYIERVPTNIKGVEVIADEEGFIKGLEFNEKATKLSEYRGGLCGPVLFIMLTK